MQENCQTFTLRVTAPLSPLKINCMFNSACMTLFFSAFFLSFFSWLPGTFCNVGVMRNKELTWNGLIYSLQWFNHKLCCQLHCIGRSHLLKGSGTLIDQLYKDYALKLGHLDFVLTFPILDSSKHYMSVQCKDVDSYSTCQRYRFPMGTLV